MLFTAPIEIEGKRQPPKNFLQMTAHVTNKKNIGLKGANIAGMKTFYKNRIYQIDHELKYLHLEHSAYGQTRLRIGASRARPQGVCPSPRRGSQRRTRQEWAR